MKHPFTLTFLFVGLLLLFFGCGSEAENPESETGSGEPKTVFDQSLLGQKEVIEKVMVKLLDQETDAPVSAAAVWLFYTPQNQADQVVPVPGRTNLDGEANFDIPAVDRLMVRSEFSHQGTSVARDPSGDTRVTLRVPTAFEVSGRVLDPDGHGLPGATLFLIPASQGPPHDLPIPGLGLSLDGFRRQFGYDMEKELETDAEGRFTCRVKTSRTLFAAAFHEDFLCPRWHGTVCSIANAQYSPLEVSLLPRATLRITLLDARNQALPSRLLKLTETRRSGSLTTFSTDFKAILQSANDGTIETDLPGGILFNAEGFLLYPTPAAGKPLPDPVRTEPLDGIRLTPNKPISLIALPPRAVRLHGSIRDSAGQPIPGAKIVLPANNLESGPDGAFSLLVPYNRHRPMGCLVKAKGFKTFSCLLPTIEENSMDLAMDVVLETSHNLILKAPEEAINLWLVLPEDRSAFSLIGLEFLPDENALLKGVRTPGNHFQFADCEPGDYTVLAQTDTFHFQRAEGLVLENQAELTEWQPLQTEEQATLEGEVRLAEGRQAHSVTVTLMRNDLPEIRRWDPLSRGKDNTGWTTVRVGQDGRFRFSGLTTGRYSVSASIVEWNTREDALAEIEIRPGNNQVVLEPVTSDGTGSVSILIQNNEGQPQSDICLFLLDPVDSPLGPSHGMGVFSYSDPTGKVILNSLPPGRYGISLSRDEGRNFILNARVIVTAKTHTEAKIVIP